MSSLEILAPAGDWEMLCAAVFSGADCVYLGVQGFNARRGAQNFDGEQLIQAVAFCHARNCRVYVAMNTLVLPGMEQNARQALQAVTNSGCDAVILQDIGLARYLRKAAPGLALHASTQLSVHSLAGVLQMAELGFSRVILSRELSEPEIAHIAQHSPIELEVFVHGALCVCVSGQCYLSAFLGGRSANRGACAGPCRLPFSAGTNPEEKKAAATEHHLSLKDLSVLDALPALKNMGIASAKIEGRLRGPEYCAVVVDSAKKALEGKPYDQRLLQDVFSRSGFTNGWYTGTNNQDMFGTRKDTQQADSKKALPETRQLYRRERPRVPISFALQLSADGGTLRVTDKTHMLELEIGEPLPLAEKDCTGMVSQSLAKTGGTPYYIEENGLTVDTAGRHIHSSLVNSLRRQLLEQLTLARSKNTKKITQETPLPLFALQNSSEIPSPSLLNARFESLSQLSEEAASLADTLVLPLCQALDIPANIRNKTRLEIPRILFGNQEQKAALMIEKTKDMGFLGYEVSNAAHFNLAKGCSLFGGFGLNITNGQAVLAAREMGCKALTLSPELSLLEMGQIAQHLTVDTPQLEAIAYGHFPVMVTRACPIKNKTNCQNCTPAPFLLDRKGKQFPLRCANGVRTIYNPVPLWMADRLSQMPVSSATLLFTVETKQQIRDILKSWAKGEKPAGEFTRGLYDKGLQK